MSSLALPVETLAATMWQSFLVGDFKKTKVLLKDLLRVRPNHARARTIQAVMAWREGDVGLALDLCTRAVKSDPQDLEALRVAARTHMEFGRESEALGFYAQAEALSPGLDTTIDHSLALLAAGHWAKGWELYQARVPREIEVFRETYGAKDQAITIHKPEWQGQPTPALLVLPEAGFGDAIQFSRYFSEFPARARVWTRKGLKRLFQNWFEATGLDHEVLTEGPMPSHSAWTFTMSAPWALASPVPSGAPYLGPGIIPAPVPSRAGRPAVGVVWGGSPLAPRDRLRSLPGELLGRLLSCDLVDWHVLQQGPYLGLLRPWEALANVHTHNLSDFLSTAEIIASLDLVVTVDTSVAHLAGAMGKPTWVMLSTTPDFRYPGREPTTPWYGSLRLFRQPTPGNWAPVVEAVLDSIEAL